MKLQDEGQPLPLNEGGFDSVGVIAEALRAKFGDDALAVAQLQAINASSESVEQWSAVVTRLAA